jgi:hypothetical protein
LRTWREANGSKSARKPNKTEKNRKKPVETGLLLLTKFFKSRKVNGGGFSQTRINTGSFFPAAAGKRECGEGEPSAASQGNCNSRLRFEQNEIRRKHNGNSAHQDSSRPAYGREA